MWGQARGNVCTVEPRKNSEITKIALACLPVNMSVPVGGKCQNSLVIQNLGIVNDLENLRGELQSGLGRPVEDSRPGEGMTPRGVLPPGAAQAVRAGRDLRFTEGPREGW